MPRDEKETDRKEWLNKDGRRLKWIKEMKDKIRNLLEVVLVS